MAKGKYLYFHLTFYLRSGGVPEDVPIECEDTQVAIMTNRDE
jgi:hypothetical protein